MPCQNQVRIPSEEEVAVVEDYTICVGKAIPNVIVAATCTATYTSAKMVVTRGGS